MAVDLTAVVVAFGGSSRLAATLDSIERATADVPHETIVIAAADDARALAESSRARILAPDANAPNTPGAHRNQGASAGTGASILFADGDVVVERGFVTDALAVLARSGDVAGVGGRIHERQWDGGRLVREIPDLHRTGAGGDVEMLAAAWIARRGAFDAAGGFDPELPAEEDMELSHRLRAAGGRLVALDVRAAYHDCAPRPSFAEIRRRFANGFYAGQGLLLRKTWGTPSFATHLARQRLFLGTFAWAVLGCGMGLAALLAGGRSATAFGFWLVTTLGAWAVMSWKKRSIALGGLSVLVWLALGAGIVHAWARGSRR